MVRLIIGCGYLGHRVAQQWLLGGSKVFAVTRSSEGAAELEREGIEPILADVTEPHTLRKLPEADTVLYSVGYDRRGGGSRQEVYADGLRTVLEALPSTPQRILYTSSTGVYGPSEGRVVDETTPCRPAREGGLAIFAAEDVLRNHRLGDRGVILRLAGIYGPGRIPRLADLLAGRPMAVPHEAHLNLIHVDDAAAAIVAAEVRAVPPAVYNIADGHPCLRRDFYRHLAALLNRPEPQFIEPDSGEALSQRAGENKQVSNARMLAELGVRLRYPSYREGLAAIVAGEMG